MFAHEKTIMLVRKYMAYKLMSSDFFLERSLGWTRAFYNVLGVRFTNFLVSAAIGSLFTSGTTYQHLAADAAEL